MGRECEDCHLRFTMRVMLPLAKRELDELNESFKRGRFRAVRDRLKIEGDWITNKLKPAYKKEIKEALHYRWKLKEAIRKAVT